MGSSLRDIPGAGGGRRRGGDRRAAKAVRTPYVPVGSPNSTKTTKSLKPGSRRRRSFGSRQPVDRVNLIIALTFAALAVLGALWLWNTNQVSVTATGVDQGATITPQQAVGLTIEIAVEPTTRLDSAVLTFDGADVTDDVNVERSDRGFVWHSPPGRGLENGDYTMGLTIPRVIRGTYEWRLDFSVQPTD